MTGPQDLAAAIRVALAQPRRDPAPADVVREASHAKAVIEANMEAVANTPLAPLSERLFLVLQLLRASCDHARAIAFLLESNPMDMAGSAMVLHRSQIEQFVRAVFFDRDASDEELAWFLEHDEVPKRPTPTGRQVKLHVNDLARIAHDRLGFGESDRLASMVGNAWDPLCGMVHGGRALRALYRDDNNVIGCLVPPPIQFQVLGNALVLTNLALVVAAERAQLDAQAMHNLLERPCQIMEAYQRARNQRMREVG